MALTDEQRAILDLETERPVWKYAAAKETAVRRQLGITMTRYFQVLNRLLDDPEAVKYAPTTVRRLVRLRDARRVARGSSRVAP